MSKKIISEIANREAFFHLLGHNPGLIILKLGATWCGPCQQIKHIVHAFFASSPANVVCGDIDVDESFDFYALLKSKKMVNGIPVFLAYARGINEGPIASITGASLPDIETFFATCINYTFSNKN